MPTRLQAFAALSLAAIGIGIALVARDLAAGAGAETGEIALLASLTLVDIVLILLAGANMRWAQYLYAGLFGVALKGKVEGLIDLPAGEPVFAAALVLGFAMQVVGLALLVVEVRAQRDTARSAA